MTELKIYKNKEIDKSGVESIEEYIGIQYNFSNPFTFYLHINDINDGKRMIRYIVYSQGKKKLIMIGYYDSREEKFGVSYGCRYKTKELHKYLKEWNEHFIMSLVTMKNRISKLIKQYSDTYIDEFIEKYEDYVQLKAWLSLQKQSKYYKPNNHEKIYDMLDENFLEKLELYLTTPNKNQIYKSIPIIYSELMITQNKLNDIYIYDDIDLIIELEEDIINLDKKLFSLIDKLLTSYENNMNIQQNEIFNDFVVDINKKFYKWISKSIYTTSYWYDNLPNCPNYDYCQIHDDKGCEIVKWGDLYDLV